MGLLTHIMTKSEFISLLMNLSEFKSIGKRQKSTNKATENFSGFNIFL
jgi:hypothetical protein